MADETFILGTSRDMPVRSDALHNRAEILQAAQRLFTTYGVEQVSMAQVAREAKVGKGTLYRHFRDKADLCMALLDCEQQTLQDQTLAYLRASPASPCELLLWFIRTLCDFTGRNMELLAEASLTRQTNHGFLLDIPAHHWQWITIRGLLGRTEFAGDVDYMADVIYALLDSRLYRFQRLVRGYSHERILNGVLGSAQLLLQTTP